MLLRDSQHPEFFLLPFLSVHDDDGQNDVESKCQCPMRSSRKPFWHYVLLAVTPKTRGLSKASKKETSFERESLSHVSSSQLRMSLEGGNFRSSLGGANKAREDTTFKHFLITCARVLQDFHISYRTLYVQCVELCNSSVSKPLLLLSFWLLSLLLISHYYRRRQKSPPISVYL